MTTEIDQLRAENSAMKERIGVLEERNGVLQTANDRQVDIIRSFTCKLAARDRKLALLVEGHTNIRRMVQQVVRDLIPEAQRKAALLGKLDDQIKHVFARFQE